MMQVRMDLCVYFKMDRLLHLHQKLWLKSRNDSLKLKKNVSQLCMHVKNLICVFWENPQKSTKIETNHKPLEIIFRKSLLCAPKRLQRMLLRLQKYLLIAFYRAGSQLYILLIFYVDLL